ncbi:MAG: TonB family protein [Muribaculaceae bacterium]|nr:TonB family protein [Muribaculaceae bacterium]
MKRGRKICNTLKEIRQRIADANEIDYTPNECRHEGDCAGTCPACESEMRYLEGELGKRQRMGRAIMVAGLGVGMAGLVSLSSCSKPTTPNSGGPDVRGRVPDTMSSTCGGGYEMLEGDVPMTDSNFISSNRLKGDDEGEQPEGYLEMPVSRYPGGEDAMLKFIKEHMVYPADARREGVHGIVVIGFDLKPNGEHFNHKVEWSIDPRLDAEALRVVKSMPRFNPSDGNDIESDAVSVAFDLK